MNILSVQSVFILQTHLHLSLNASSSIHTSCTLETSGPIRAQRLCGITCCRAGRLGRAPPGSRRRPPQSDPWWSGTAACLSGPSSGGPGPRLLSETRRRTQVRGGAYITSYRWYNPNPWKFFKHPWIYSRTSMISSSSTHSCSPANWLVDTGV